MLEPIAMMHFLPSNRDKWFAVVLFPFKAYMGLGLICWLIWKQATDENRIQNSLAEATVPVVIGYTLCAAVFLLSGVILFLTKKRGDVAFNMLLAGVALAVAGILSTFCVQ